MDYREIKTVKRNEGKSDGITAFIFSCPGQSEQKSGKLVNGQTGKNLDMLLTILHEQKPELFPYTDRYDYRITNSSEQVHYKAYDRKTEPSQSEISDPENLKRLCADIVSYRYVIVFGNSALRAVKALEQQGACEGIRFIRSPHLSFLSLNSSIQTDVSGSPILPGSKDASLKRMEVVAQRILAQL